MSAYRVFGAQLVAASEFGAGSSAGKLQDAIERILLEPVLKKIEEMGLNHSKIDIAKRLSGLDEETAENQNQNQYGQSASSSSNQNHNQQQAQLDKSAEPDSLRLFRDFYGKHRCGYVGVVCGGGTAQRLSGAGVRRVDVSTLVSEHVHEHVHDVEISGIEHQEMF